MTHPKEQLTRETFEKWYTENVFNKPREFNAWGFSLVHGNYRVDDCRLMFAAWQAVLSALALASVPEGLDDRIKGALLTYRCQHIEIEDDGGGLPLVDVFSQGTQDIRQGVDECELLAEHIAIALSAASASPQAPGEGSVDALLRVHAGLLEENHYAYFELAYTRHTGWMAWLCDRPQETHPDRKVIAQGQGDTPEGACASALATLPAPPAADTKGAA